MSKAHKYITAAVIVTLAIVSLFVSCRINTPPIVEIEEGNEVSVVNGATAQFTAVVTDPDEGQEIAYQWFVDGEALDGATKAYFGYVTGPLNNPKTHTVRVVATDERGGTGEDSAELTVNPAEYYPLDRTGDFEFSLDLGSNPRDVYFLFTNTTVLNQSTPAVCNAVYRKQVHIRLSCSRPILRFGEHAAQRYEADRPAGLPGDKRIQQRPARLRPKDRFAGPLRRRAGAASFVYSRREYNNI